MVWGAFDYGGKMELQVINRHLNAAGYQRLLENADVIGEGPHICGRDHGGNRGGSHGGNHSNCDNQGNHGKCGRDQELGHGYSSRTMHQFTLPVPQRGGLPGTMSTFLVSHHVVLVSIPWRISRGGLPGMSTLLGTSSRTLMLFMMLSLSPGLPSLNLCCILSLILCQSASLMSFIIVGAPPNTK